MVAALKRVLGLGIPEQEKVGTHAREKKKNALRPFVKM